MAFAHLMHNRALFLGTHVGDFRNGAFDLGWDVFTPEEQERKRTIELNQGRAAMMGILALMVSGWFVLLVILPTAELACKSV